MWTGLKKLHPKTAKPSLNVSSQFNGFQSVIAQWIGCPTGSLYTTILDMFTVTQWPSSQLQMYQCDLVLSPTARALCIETVRYVTAHIFRQRPSPLLCFVTSSAPILCSTAHGSASAPAPLLLFFRQWPSPLLDCTCISQWPSSSFCMTYVSRGDLVLSYHIYIVQRPGHPAIHHGASCL